MTKKIDIFTIICKKYLTEEWHKGIIIDIINESFAEKRSGIYEIYRHHPESG